MSKLIYKKLKTNGSKILFKFIEKHHLYIKLSINTLNRYVISSTETINTLSIEERNKILEDIEELSKSIIFLGSSESKSINSLTFELEFKCYFIEDVFTEIKEYFNI